MSDSLFLLVACETETFVLGVYASQKEAEEDFIDILLKQRNLPDLKFIYKKEFNKKLPTKAHLLKRLFFPNIADEDHNQDITDFLSDTVQCRIKEVKMGQIFDFTDYCDWNSKNLYCALNEVQNGATGRLSWPFALINVMLNNII